MKSLGTGHGVEHSLDLPVYCEVGVLGVAEVPEEDVDRGAFEIVAEEAASIDMDRANYRREPPATNFRCA